MCAPKTLSVVSSAKILTKPSASSNAIALEFAMNENLPILYFVFNSFNCY